MLVFDGSLSSLLLVDGRSSSCGFTCSFICKLARLSNQSLESGHHVITDMIFTLLLDLFYRKRTQGNFIVQYNYVE